MKDSDDYEAAVERAFKLRVVFERKLFEKDASKLGTVLQPVNGTFDQLAYEAVSPVKDWSEGLKYITGENRPDRAED